MLVTLRVEPWQAVNAIPGFLERLRKECSVNKVENPVKDFCPIPEPYFPVPNDPAQQVREWRRAKFSMSMRERN
jgi:hypothetical protein